MPEFYEKVKLHDNTSIELMTTSGGSDSFGPTLNVLDENGAEILIFVVDSKAKIQLCFVSEYSFRLSIEDLERVIVRAKAVVKYIPILGED